MRSMLHQTDVPFLSIECPPKLIRKWNVYSLFRFPIYGSSFPLTTEGHIDVSWFAINYENLLYFRHSISHQIEEDHPQFDKNPIFGYTKYDQLF